MGDGVTNILGGLAAMKQRRWHIEGQRAHITRRCRGGRYLLRPDDYINHAVAYDVGYSAMKHHQEISALTMMSNHYHLVTLDRKAKRSAFVGRLNRRIGERLRRHRGITGGCWEERAYGDTILIDDKAEMEHLLYVWLNPVKDGLVEKVEDWPGYQILPRHWGKEITVTKPKKHFGRSGPDTVTWTPKPPPSLRHLPLEKAIALAEAKIAERERQIAAARREKDKKSVLGRALILGMDPLDRPDEPTLNRRACPVIACDDEALKKKVEEAYRIFLDTYETQRQRWLIGKSVTFPCGTLKLRYQAPVQCHGPTDDHPGLYDPKQEDCTGSLQGQGRPSDGGVWARTTGG